MKLTRIVYSLSEKMSFIEEQSVVEYNHIIFLSRLFDHSCKPLPQAVQVYIPQSRICRVIGLVEDTGAVPQPPSAA